MVHRIQLESMLGLPATALKRPQPAPTGPGFASILRRSIGPRTDVAFSAHAQQRLNERSLEISPGDTQRIEKAVDAAAAKGSRKTLLLTGDAALVVSVPNRTVITVFSSRSDENVVVTNIDSVVLVSRESHEASGHRSNGPDPILGSPSAAERQTRHLL